MALRFFIRDRSRANNRAAQPPPSTRPAPISSAPGRVFLSKRTEADFQAWRDQRDWTARKYAMWDAGKRLEPPSYGPGKPCSRFMKCPCGEVFDMHGPEAVLVHVCLTSRPQGRRQMLLPHGAITAEHENAKKKRSQPEAQPPSTHISVRESVNAATISK